MCKPRRPDNTAIQCQGVQLWKQVLQHCITVTGSNASTQHKSQVDSDHLSLLHMIRYVGPHQYVDLLRALLDMLVRVRLSTKTSWKFTWQLLAGGHFLLEAGIVAGVMAIVHNSLRSKCTQGG